jgi:hypothetical protein
MSNEEAEVYSGDMRGCDECGVGPEDECVPDCPWVAAAEDAATTGSPSSVLLTDVLKNIFPNVTE